MKRLSLLLVAAASLMTACSNENPVGVDVSIEPPGSVTRVIPLQPKTVPFRGRFATTFEFVPPFPNPPGQPFSNFVISGIGEATHLGRTTLLSPSQVNVLNGNQTGSAVLTAANGDELSFDFAGVSSPGPQPGDIVFNGSFDFTGGTGRFGGATGGGTYSGTANVIAGVGQLELNGALSRPGPRRQLIQY